MVCVALAAVVAYLLLERSRSQRVAKDLDSDPVIASGPAATAQAKVGAEPSSAISEPALAPVELSPERMQEVGVTTATAEVKTVSNELDLPGNVDIDEQGLSYVQTRFSGWIENVFANATFQYVREGQPLFTVYSPDLVSSEQEYLLAQKDRAVFSHQMEGHSMPGVASQESDWLAQAARQRLEQFGVEPEEISALEKSGRVEKNLTVYSPVSGYVTERNALRNAYVQPETKIYTIADLSTIWVYANVYQNDIATLRPGDAAKVTLDSYPGRTFIGRIDQILPQVDQATRTVKVRLVLANPGLALKPGMFVNVEIAVNLGRQLVVPISAVLQSGQQAVTFIDRGQGHLEPRTVTTGPQIDGYIVILSGLKPGDRVVSSANFLVDSEAQLQAALQNFTPPSQPPTTANTPNSEQVQIAFITQPSPPKKGDNTIRVKLTGSDDKPISGAHVAVTFIMPAMPAMGMSAEHVSVALSDKGDGSYEGPVQLESGGTWHVTVTARRNGQTIAARQLSVDATGGM